MKAEIKVPAVGESINEATIAEWLKRDGDTISRDEILLNLETDKANVEVVAEHDGVLKIQEQGGATVAIGATIGFIDTDASAPSLPDADNPITPPLDSEEEKLDLNDLSPAARHAALEHSMDPSQINGTGKDGRVTKVDIMQHAKSAPAVKKSPTQPAEKAPAAKTSATQSAGSDRREKMSTIRKRIAQRLVMAQYTAAILTTFNEVDLTEVKVLRTKYKEKFKEKYSVNLGFMGFFTKAVIEALKKYPAVNAFIEGEEIIYHDYASIGIAVGSPRGLVVPVLKNAENMSIADIEQGIKAAALKARDGKLTIDDMSGGTFTISNGGTYGSLMSTPILNPPQSGILGMHKIEDRPVAVNGKVEIRPIMYIALSYDHRIIDGEGAVKFLVHIKNALEDPARILLEI